MVGNQEKRNFFSDPPLAVGELGNLHSLVPSVVGPSSDKSLDELLQEQNLLFFRFDLQAFAQILKSLDGEVAAVFWDALKVNADEVQSTQAVQQFFGRHDFSFDLMNRFSDLAQKLQEQSSEFQKLQSAITEKLQVNAEDIIQFIRTAKP